MAKLQVYLEELQLPIKSLFVASVLIAIGTFLGNPFVNEILKLDVPIIITLTNIVLFTGGLILRAFPFTVFVKLLQIRTKEQNTVIVGIISYLVYLIMILFFSASQLPKNVYVKFLVFELKSTELRLMTTGVFGLFGIYYIIRKIYQKPMHARNSNFTKLFDRDLIRLMNSLTLSVLFGLTMSFVFPYVLTFVYKVLSFIASDFTNPMSLFAYSAFERVSVLFGLDNIVRNEMWFTTMGGTWNSLENVTYVGDVNIWAAQLKDSIAILGAGSAGRFTTLYYILNLFAMPAYLLAVSATVTDRKKKRRSLITVLLGSLLSMLSGIVYPIEVIMILSTPVLYLFHIFMSGFISASLLGLSVTLGFSYSGILSAASPGNIIDFIALSNNNIMSQQILLVGLFGILVFFIYYYVTRFYYKNIAMDVLNIGIKDDEATDFIERIGGLDNLMDIHSLPTKIIVTLKDEDKINTEGLHYQGVTKIIHAREGFILSYGAGSYMLQLEVKKRLKNHLEAKEDENDK